jgi:hypothetical protein
MCILHDECGNKVVGVYDLNLMKIDTYADNSQKNKKLEWLNSFFLPNQDRLSG